MQLRRPRLCSSRLIRGSNRPTNFRGLGTRPGKGLWPQAKRKRKSVKNQTQDSPELPQLQPRSSQPRMPRTPTCSADRSRVSRELRAYMHLLD
ncbi:hypothetical protein NDU88_002298 [Pleurodeles waltl]|uniref:Uncharacterized protein n=1 Tax=Pleurodeles waltl TaxID=8319 RepID=A0AAV7WR91_PLEWA|nr:hypothetical protein NDU88_002298 [Pleurodeles waltl]